jgi:ferritin-like metal-binding protein YciE
MVSINNYFLNHLKLKTMENKKGITSTASQNGQQTKERSDNGLMYTSQLMKLFEEQLKDIYWAEKALTKAIPEMIDNATSTELIDALTGHLEETEQHVVRLEQVFESFDKKAVAKKCEAMDGLINEAEEIMDSCEEGPMCDAGIIMAAQKVEHYEIAAYGTLRQFAETLGLTEAASLLEETLNEEKAADEKLTEVAIDAINIEAAQVDA